MGSLLQDLRYAFRVLLHKPGFTIVAVLTLALGIGANATIFSVVDAIVFRPLPVNDPGSLVRLFNTSNIEIVETDNLSYPDYVDLRDKNDVFSSMLAFDTASLVFGKGDHSDVATGYVASGNFFDMLGVQARLGKTFHPEDDEPAAAPVAVISYAAWQRRFGSDPNIVGQRIDLSSTPFTIVGVAPEGFTGLLKPYSPEFWIPIGKHATLRDGGAASLQNRQERNLDIVGRLKPGVTLEQAKANMTALARGLAEVYPDTNLNRGLLVIPANRIAVDPSLDKYVYIGSAFLMTLSGSVLLIACANLANLLLARGMARRREMAIRLSVGGSRRRLIRQLLTESVVLAVMGGAAGLLVAMWCAAFLNVIKLPLPIDFALGVQLDWRVLAFTFAVSVATGIVFGLIPALHASKLDLNSALKDESGAVKGSRGRALLRSALVVGQVTVSLVLLIFAGLAVRSLRNATSMDPGFNPRNVVVATIAPRLSSYGETKGRAFFRELLARLNALPGVESASMTANLPLTLSVALSFFTLEVEEQLPENQRRLVDMTMVSPEYFRTVGIPFIAGRDFSERDQDAASQLVVINETMARRFWPNENPVGRRFSTTLFGAQLRRAEIIGVVKDGKYRTLGEEPRPFVYANMVQNYAGMATLIVRAGGDTRTVFADIRKTVSSIDRSMPVFGLMTLTERIGPSLLLPKYAAMLFGAFGVLGTLLAVVGLYGVVSYSVSQRTHEIGVRMALGGQRSDILKLVVGEGMVLTGVGLALGLAGALVLARFISVILYGIGSADPVTFIGISVLMIVVTLEACYIPARRASGVEPTVALRYE